MGTIFWVLVFLWFVCGALAYINFLVKYRDYYTSDIFMTVLSGLCGLGTVLLTMAFNTNSENKTVLIKRGPQKYRSLHESR